MAGVRKVRQAPKFFSALGAHANTANSQGRGWRTAENQELPPSVSGQTPIALPRVPRNTATHLTGNRDGGCRAVNEADAGGRQRRGWQRYSPQTTLAAGTELTDCLPLCRPDRLSARLFRNQAAYARHRQMVFQKTLLTIDRRLRWWRRILSSSGPGTRHSCT